MKAIPTELPEVLILEPRVFADDRGYFFESWNERAFAEATGVDVRFVQDNHSYSMRNVLRGIHYQVVRPQGKLVRVVAGTVLDVAVDLRRSSPTLRALGCRRTECREPSAALDPARVRARVRRPQRGCHFLYKTTEYWFAEHDRSLRWNDPQLAVDWGLDGEPILAAKDAGAPLLVDAEVFA